MTKPKKNQNRDKENTVSYVPDLQILEKITGLAAMNGRVPPNLREILRYASELAGNVKRGNKRCYNPPCGPSELVRFLDRNESQPRWACSVFYRTHAGLLEAEHSFEELSELHCVIEQGPSFYAIDRIEIRTAAPSTMTLEQSLTI